MDKSYILYNPMAADGTGAQKARRLDAILPDREKVYRDITRIGNYAAFFAGMERGDDVILCGGDGTLNHFINDVAGIEPTCPVQYFATGSGNDFLRDVEKSSEAPFSIDRSIRKTPYVAVNGKRRRCINGLGAGVDGYCIREVDAYRKKTGKKASYLMKAVGGVLGGFMPGNAVIRVDGTEHTFGKVWMAAAMYGRFFGGGMKIAPGQDRNDPQGQLTLMVIHGLNRLRFLTLFPTVYKGTHVRFTKYITVLKGREIDVEFDRTMEMQIDGEIEPNIRRYRVRWE